MTITTGRRIRLGPDASLVSPAVIPRGIVQPDTRHPWFAVLAALAVVVLIAGYVSARGGAVDHTHYGERHVGR